MTSDPFAAREIAQTTGAGDHRPLKTAPNLRQGWALVDLDARALWTALDYLYQRHTWFEKQKMSLQELKDEFKQYCATESDNC